MTTNPDSQADDRSDLPPKDDRPRWPSYLFAVVVSFFGVFVLIVMTGFMDIAMMYWSRHRVSRREQCSNNLKQIGMAMQYYESKYGCFPPAFITDQDGKPLHSWRVLLLPFLEEDALYKQYRFDEPWNGPHNIKLAERMPNVYHCPSSTGGASETSYAMIVGPHAISDGPTARKASEITDGLSNTIMVAEAAGAHINWLEPRDIDTQKTTFRIVTLDNDNPKQTCCDISSGHLGGAYALLCDGGVTFLSASIKPEDLEALTTIDGGEAVNW